MSLYDKLFKRKKRMFREYLILVKENKSQIMYRMTEEKAYEEFDEEFLETLIFSERLKLIIKRHEKEIEKELLAMYPQDEAKREQISNYCGKEQVIIIRFKQGLQNKLEVYNQSIA